jgi:hypothetical protein
VVLSLTFRGTISDLLANASAQAAWEALFVAASRAFPSLTRSILTEIYLCHGCAYHEMLRMETPGQAMATELRIAASRIRVLGIHAGSFVVVFEIVDTARARGASAGAGAAATIFDAVHIA